MEKDYKNKCDCKNCLIARIRELEFELNRAKGKRSRWFKLSDRVPTVENNGDIEVLCRVTGLSMTASEYEEYKVITYRDGTKCFIEWEGGNVIKYNNADRKVNSPIVTHWRYFNKIEAPEGE